MNNIERNQLQQQSYDSAEGFQKKVKQDIDVTEYERMQTNNEQPPMDDTTSKVMTNSSVENPRTGMSSREEKYLAKFGGRLTGPVESPRFKSVEQQERTPSPRADLNSVGLEGWRERPDSQEGPGVSLTANTTNFINDSAAASNGIIHFNPNDSPPSDRNNNVNYQLPIAYDAEVVVPFGMPGGSDVRILEDTIRLAVRRDVEDVVRQEFLRNTVVAESAVAVSPTKQDEDDQEEASNEALRPFHRAVRSRKNAWVVSFALLAVAMAIGIIIVVVLRTNGGGNGGGTEQSTAVETKVPTTRHPTFSPSSMRPLTFRPTTAMSSQQPITRYRAIANNQVLREAINAYLSGDAAKKAQVTAAYGNPIGSWNVSLVTDFSNAFLDFAFFEEDIGQWDTSSATNMASMFQGARSFNSDLSGWNTSQVTNMNNMFCNASSFNSDVSQWNTLKVVTMDSMFHGAETFDGILSSWDVSNVISMEGMFYSAHKFKGDGLDKWNVSMVTNIENMFRDAVSFNTDIIGWDVSRVTSMAYTFASAATFRGSNMDKWNVSQVTSFALAFSNAAMFDGNLTGWDVSSAVEMQGMFFKAKSFRGLGLEQWDVSKVTYMDGMFCEAVALNDLNLSSWDVSKVTSMFNMFAGCPNFTGLGLDGWNVSAATEMYYMFSQASAFNVDLCRWGPQLNGKNISVDHMFANTACDFKNDPDLRNTSITSFCFSCVNQ